MQLVMSIMGDPARFQKVVLCRLRIESITSSKRAFLALSANQHFDYATLVRFAEDAWITMMDAWITMKDDRLTMKDDRLTMKDA